MLPKKPRTKKFTPLYCPFCHMEVAYSNKSKTVGFCIEHSVEIQRLGKFITYYTFSADGALEQLNKVEIK